MINTSWWFCGALLRAELSLVGWDGASQEDWILSLGSYLLDLEIWTQIRKGKKQDKWQTKTWDLEQIKTSLMSATMNELFYLPPSGASGSTSKRRLCTRAGLLVFNSCLLKTHYVPDTVSGIWVQWWTEKSKIFVEVAWWNPVKGL